MARSSGEPLSPLLQCALDQTDTVSEWFVQQRVRSSRHFALGWAEEEVPPSLLPAWLRANQLVEARSRARARLQVHSAPALSSRESEAVSRRAVAAAVDVKATVRTELVLQAKRARIVTGSSSSAPSRTEALAADLVRILLDNAPFSTKNVPRSLRWIHAAGLPRHAQGPFVLVLRGSFGECGRGMEKMDYLDGFPIASRLPPPRESPARHHFPHAGLQGIGVDIDQWTSEECGRGRSEPRSPKLPRISSIAAGPRL